ncbi:MAG: polyprenyl synthetase family protein [Gemmatimonadales bacterium]
MASPASPVARLSLAEVLEPVKSDLDTVFDEIVSLVRSDLHMIDGVNQHLLQIRGKMFRPALVLLSAHATGGVSEREIKLAAVVELIHLATLIHDDSVDHSALRRGQPTVSAQFSHEIAVIMGDYLYSRAIEVLVGLDSLEPLRIMSRVTNELTIGEMREVAAHDLLDFSEADYEELIRAKTASLMAGACEIGSLAGEPSLREPLRRYGLHLGTAFQIADDLLDYTASEAVTGKPNWQDLREHKITLPLIVALPQMTPGERAHVEELMSDPLPSDELIRSVVRIVEDRGGIAVSRERAHRLVQKAEAELGSLPAGWARDALFECVTYSVERRR